MALADILSQVCNLYAYVGGVWVDLGLTSEDGTVLRVDPETTRINSSQKPQPVDVLGGKAYIELRVTLQEVNRQNVAIAFPGSTVATSAAGSGMKGSIGEGLFPGASLRAQGKKLKLDPVDPSQDGGVFIALATNINPVEVAFQGRDIRTLPLNFVCFEDESETSGQKVVCWSDHASTDITGW